MIFLRGDLEMDANYQFEAGNDASGAGVMVQERWSRDVAMKEERLPFTVKVVACDEELQKVVSIRQSAYARHIPELAEKLKVAESSDHDEDSIILLAESKLDGSPMGTMRIQTNRQRELPLERAMPFPDWLASSSLAHFSRLGIQQGLVGRLVKVALFKASYLLCLQSDIDHIVLAARSPLDRQYSQLLFDDAYPDAGFVPLASAGNVPHRLMKAHVSSLDQRWRDADCKLYPFMVKTHHPDIDLSNADFSSWGRSSSRSKAFAAAPIYA
jgi:hypothetical protein